MDKDNRKYRFCFIDYMWYVAEKWSEREHNNLNGRMLLFLCWLFAITIPLGIPLLFRLFSWIIAFAIVMILCFLPDLFCQLRYTAGRREALRKYYGKMKHSGRKLAKIVLIVIALTVANFPLMSISGAACQCSACRGCKKLYIWYQPEKEKSGTRAICIEGAVCWN